MGVAGQLVQFISAVVVGKIASVFVPGPQHDPLRGLALDRQLMDAGPMRMAVDDSAHAGDLECRGHCVRVHVHNLVLGLRRMLPASGARLIRHQAAIRHRQ